MSIIDEVVRHYLDSGDFNGRYSDPDRLSRDQIIEIRMAIEAGLLELIDEADFVNPSIRPWPSSRSTKEQSERAAVNPAYALYPTSRVLKDLPETQSVDGYYRRLLSEGEGQLTVHFFSFDVLEKYRNDPMFSFSFEDFGASASISDKAYAVLGNADPNSILLHHMGYAYDLSDFTGQDDAPKNIRRFVAVFTRDLGKLTVHHQQHWQIHEVQDEKIEPHPNWWASQMGHWPDGAGPFERFFAELQFLNDVATTALGVPLLNELNRPREFGWLIRSSQHEFDAFVVTMDKLLSDNIRHKALDVVGAPDKGEDGANLGTLVRLEAKMLKDGVPEEAVKRAMDPLRAIRRARQNPAHRIVLNTADSTFVDRQAALLREVTYSIMGIRTYFENLAGGAGPDAPDSGVWYFL